MATIQIIIMAITLAARYEPYIASVLHLVLPALEKLHAEHDDTVMLADIKSVLRQFDVRIPNVVSALQQAGERPGPEGQSQPQI